jgi:hypothetical protein
VRKELSVTQDRDYEDTIGEFAGGKDTNWRSDDVPGGDNLGSHWMSRRAEGVEAHWFVEFLCRFGQRKVDFEGFEAAPAQE